MSDLIVQLVDDEEIDLAVLRADIVDRRGQHAKVQEGTEHWVSDDETKIAIVPNVADSANALTATARAAGPLTANPDGTESPVDARLVADADLAEDSPDGAGQMLVTLARVHFHVVGGQAAGAAVTAGVPRKQVLP